MSPVAGIQQPQAQAINQGATPLGQPGKQAQAPNALQNAQAAHPHRAKAARVFSAIFSLGITEAVRAGRAYSNNNKAAILGTPNAKVTAAIARGIALAHEKFGITKSFADLKPYKKLTITENPEECTFYKTLAETAQKSKHTLSLKKLTRLATDCANSLAVKDYLHEQIGADYNSDCRSRIFSTMQEEFPKETEKLLSSHSKKEFDEKIAKDETLRQICAAPREAFSVWKDCNDSLKEGHVADLKQAFPDMDKDVQEFLLSNKSVRTELLDRQMPTILSSMKNAQTAENIVQKKTLNASSLHSEHTLTSQHFGKTLTSLLTIEAGKIDTCDVSDALKAEWKKDLLTNFRAPHETTEQTDQEKIENAPAKFSYPVESDKLANHVKNEFENLTQALQGGKGLQDVVESGHNMFASYQQHMGEVEQRIGEGYGADDRAKLWTMTSQALADKQPAFVTAFQGYTNKNQLLQLAEDNAAAAISARPPKNFFTLGGAERMQVAAAMQNNKDIRVGFNNMLQFFNNAQAPAQGAE